MSDAEAKMASPFEAAPGFVLVDAGRRLTFRAVPPAAAATANTCSWRSARLLLVKTIRPFTPGNDAEAGSATAHAATAHVRATTPTDPRIGRQPSPILLGLY
jgi:hypothetical protein